MIYLMKCKNGKDEPVTGRLIQVLPAPGYRAFGVLPPQDGEDLAVTEIPVVGFGLIESQSNTWGFDTDLELLLAAKYEPFTVRMFRIYGFVALTVCNPFREFTSADRTMLLGDAQEVIEAYQKNQAEIESLMSQIRQCMKPAEWLQLHIGLGQCEHDDQRIAFLKAKLKQCGLDIPSSATIQ
jgi:hypothetical protein